MRVNRTILKNGLKILHYHMPWLNSVSIAYFVKAGSRDEGNPSLYGISHFLEHMMFNGSRKYPDKHLATLKAEEHGIYQNAWTFNDATSYWTISKESEFDFSMEILTDRVFGALVRNEDIEIEKGIISEEVKMGEDDPYRKLWRTYLNIIYKGSPLEHDVIGTLDSVNSFTREQLKGYMKDYYSPSNMVLAVAGNVDFSSVVEKAKKLTPEGDGFVNKRKQLKDLFKSEQKEFINKDYVQQTIVLIGYKSFGIGSKEKYPLALLNALLGSGNGAKLLNELKIKDSFVSSVETEINAYEDVGSYTISFETEVENVKKVIKKLYKVLDEIKSGKVQEKEFKRAKMMVESGFKFMYESSKPIIDFQSFAHRELLLGKEINPEEEAKKYRKVRLEDVLEVANKVLERDKSTIVVVGNEERVMEDF